MHIDTLIHARWIVPMEPQATVHEHWSLAVHEGRILALLPTGEAQAAYTADTVHHLDQHVLIPGLVNGHTHGAMTLMRGLADDLPLMDWLQKHIWPAEQRWVNEDFVHDGTLLAAAEMLRGGITCFNDMYFFPDVTARACADIGLRATVGLIVLDFPSAWAADADEYLAKGVALHDRYRGHPLIRTAFAPHAPYTVSDGPLQRIQTYVDELDIPIHMHVHETAQEVNDAVAATGERPLARLERLGLLSPNLLAVHMTQLQDDEIALAAERGITVVHCPESNMKLASGFCPVQRLLDAGVNVALGTDGAASNDDLDLMGEVKSAAMLAKVVAGDAAALPAHRALRLATLNGARALGLENEIGSLEPGKAADVVAFDLAGVETEPVYHVISQLVYASGRERVTDVWVNGAHLLAGRRLTTIDEAQVLEATRAWRERIATYA